MAFCEWLSKKEGVTYRLPSEAEWEYACRAGTTTTYYTGDELKPDQANIPGDAPRQTTPVGRCAPNAFGLHDTLGNVHEWCRDWHAPWYYAGSPPGNPLGPSTGSNGVIRGGSYWDGGRFVKSANRSCFPPAFRFFHTGFRVVREL